MRLIRLEGKNDKVYTCNVFLITGEWKRLEDVNTLIDVGADPSILETLDRANTGVGKRKVERVILTHGHSDHTSILPLIRQVYNPEVLAFSPYLDGVDRVLSNGEKIRCGDRDFEVVHTPGHTEDSISLLCEEEGVIFVGDSPVIIHSVGGTYSPDFVATMKRLCTRNIEKIYFGHGNPVCQGARQQLTDSLRIIRESIRLHASLQKGGEQAKEQDRCLCPPESATVYKGNR